MAVSHGTTLHAQGPQHWHSLKRHFFPSHHWIPSDFDLGAFLAWLPPAPWRAQYVVALSDHSASSPSSFWTGLATSTCHSLWRANLALDWLQSCGCELCGPRGGYQWPWDGPWVCHAGRGSSDIDGNEVLNVSAQDNTTGEQPDVFYE